MKKFNTIDEFITHYVDAVDESRRDWLKDILTFFSRANIAELATTPAKARYLADELQELKQPAQPGTYGDTGHDNPAVVYGYNEALDDIVKLISGAPLVAHLPEVTPLFIKEMDGARDEVGAKGIGYLLEIKPRTTLETLLIMYDQAREILNNALQEKLKGAAAVDTSPAKSAKVESDPAVDVSVMLSTTQNLGDHGVSVQLGKEYIPGETVEGLALRLLTFLDTFPHSPERHINSYTDVIELRLVEPATKGGDQ